MLLIVLAGMAVAASFGLPLLPIAVVGSFLLSVAAYLVTRDKRMLQVGAALAMVAICHYLLLPVMFDGVKEVPNWLTGVVRSDVLMWIVASCVGLISTINGILGHGRSGPEDVPN